MYVCDLWSDQNEVLGEYFKDTIIFFFIEEIVYRRNRKGCCYDVPNDRSLVGLRWSGCGGGRGQLWSHLSEDTHISWSPGQWSPQNSSDSHGDRLEDCRNIVPRDSHERGPGR